MKSNPISIAGTILLVLLFSFTKVQSQSFGTFASAVWISDCNQSNFFNTTGTGANLIGPTANVFENANLGVHTQNSGTLILRGAQVKTFKNPASSNVCSVRMYYRVYLQSGTPGTFNTIDLPFLDDCNTVAGQFPSGGPCAAGDQKWQRVINDGTTVPYAPVNLTGFAPGNYVLEVYYDAAGSFTTTNLCNDIVTLNNGGSNYKSFFSIQLPTIVSVNPSTCNGAEGSITINGLVPGAMYIINYTDDGVPVGLLSLTANASGQIIFSGLNAGLYSNFSFLINGCTTNLFTGTILSNPIFIPTFNAIPPFCAGTTAPVLPATSNNGISGTWSPAIISNTASGTYTFTPTAGQCGLQIPINVTVIPRTNPTFSIPSSICNGATAPSLPTISNNGITGTWSPSTVSNTTSGSYTFTPNSNQCANPVTINIAVNPNITPTFSFPTSICEGATAPTLPTTSDNGITGTWSPLTVSNTISGSYTFTPTAGQCAVATTINVTVNPNVAPTFSIPSSICNGSAAPTLPTTSNNGITGTWNPSTVSNTASGSYTFTPTAGVCATPVTINITVNPILTPSFSIPSSICEGATAPTLPTISGNGITGTWSPLTVSNTASGSYTFTPNAGECATPVTINITVNPILTPSFSIPSSICEGATAPTLPTISGNGITGTWSPLTVSNTASGSYTFTPTAGQCAVPVTINVTVNPILTPSFSFATTICSGATAPSLPATSTNGITGTWSPSTVSNTTSGTYTFTPNAGQCGTSIDITISVTPNTTPVFNFGPTLTICSGETVPASLPLTSANGITGTWSPATVSNTSSGVYTFTPTAGVCATVVTYTVTVNPIVTPTFGFTSNQSICIGASVPELLATSTNGITGTWSPAVISNQASGSYTFTPTAGLCASVLTVNVEVNPVPSINALPHITVNDGAIVPAVSITPSPSNATISWVNSNPAIGLAASGNGNVPQFTAVNLGNTDIIATVIVTPRINGCIGTPVSYRITVRALNKDVFVPNVFSPNGDNKNDLLLVYGNYINKLEMHIFNQWGQFITVINNKSQGWDGTHKGKPQPVGVYVYVLKAVLADGRTVNLKGSVTLIR